MRREYWTNERFPIHQESVSSVAKALNLSCETIQRDIRDKGEEQGVWRFGKHKRTVRINPFVYLWHHRLKVLRADPELDARLYEITGFLLPLLLAVKVAVDNLIEQLAAARDAAALRIHQVDKYTSPPPNGKVEG
jgi:hypothetical protein